VNRLCGKLLTFHRRVKHPAAVLSTRPTPQGGAHTSNMSCVNTIATVTPFSQMKFLRRFSHETTRSIPPFEVAVCLRFRNGTRKATFSWARLCERQLIVELTRTDAFDPGAPIGRKPLPSSPFPLPPIRACALITRKSLWMGRCTWTTVSTGTVC
jgi:hypothetical protein